MFNSIINGAAEKFGLGEKAGALVSALLALMTDSGNGGFAGFLNRFKKAGLGDLADSWVTSGANAPISYEQTESAFGTETLNEISEQVGIDYKTTVSATAYLIPHLVNDLTPNGKVPNESDLLSRIGGYLTGASGAVAGGLGARSAVGDTFDRVDASVGNTERRPILADDISGEFDANDESENKTALSWLLPLLILGLLLILGYWFCGGKSEPVATTNANASKANTNLNANTGSVNSAENTSDSSFKIEAKDSKYSVSGVVPDQATLDKIKASLTAQFGAGNVDFSGLKIDAKARPFAANWWTNFEQMLPNFKGWTNGTLSFVGNSIETASGLPAAALEQLKSLFGGWTMPVSVMGAEGATKQANEEALRELQVAGSVEDVVRALNISIINFASGKSDIPADAKPILEKAAEILKQQAEGTVIEIGGHTDSDGDDAANMKLSQARADSVKKALVDLGVKDIMVTAKGYGETASIVPNDTSDNKFKNRRIEYKTASGSSPTATTTEIRRGNTNAASSNAIR